MFFVDLERCTQSRFASTGKNAGDDRPTGSQDGGRLRHERQNCALDNRNQDAKKGSPFPCAVRVRFRLSTVSLLDNGDPVASGAGMGIAWGHMTIPVSHGTTTTPIHRFSFLRMKREKVRCCR